jgi:hypothetical protein
MRALCPAHRILPDINHTNSAWWSVEVMKLLMMYFSQSHCYIPSPKSKYHAAYLLQKSIWRLSVTTLSTKFSRNLFIQMCGNAIVQMEWGTIKDSLIIGWFSGNLSPLYFVCRAKRLINVSRKGLDRK